MLFWNYMYISNMRYAALYFPWNDHMLLSYRGYGCYEKFQGNLPLNMTTVTCESKGFKGGFSHESPINVYHYNDVITGVMASQITSLTSVYSTVYSDADQRKHQSSASLAFVRGIHWGPVNSQHKWPVTRKMFPFDDVIMMKKPVVFPTILTHQ